MAAGKWRIYGTAGEAIINGSIDLDDDDYRMVLIGTGYTPDQSADDAWSDMSANEITGTGYSAGGVVTDFTISVSGVTVTVDLTDEEWADSTIADAKYAAVVRDADGNGTLASTDMPVMFCNLETGGGTVSTTSGALSVAINASGAATVTFGSSD